MCTNRAKEPSTMQNLQESQQHLIKHQEAFQEQTAAITLLAPGTTPPPPLPSNTARKATAATAPEEESPDT